MAFAAFGIFQPTASYAMSSPTAALSWLDRNVWKKIVITGNRQLGLHLDSVSGDSSAFQSLTYFGQGGKTFTDIGQMSVNGQNVLGLFNFNLQFADSRYQDPLSSRFSLDFHRKGFAFDAGDITGTLASGNQFLSFSRQLWGVQVKVIKGRTFLAMLHSVAHGSTQTFSFQGNGSSGPYYLRDSQIIPDSVKVQVDGQQLTFPNDYTVDSVVGAINFTNRIIPATSTIIVSYESMAVNSSDGSIDGLASTYDLGKLGEIGFGIARQTMPGANSLSTVDDRYQGYGDPSTPYFLQYIPLASAPIIIRVDGVIQSPNIDYYFSPSNPVVFYFKRYVPSTSTIDVFYTPQPTSNLNGNRTDYGFNYQLNFGKQGKDGLVNYSQAWSTMSSPTQPLSGLARGLTGNYRYKDYNFIANLSDIPDGFVGIQSASFLRNAQDTMLGVNYRHKAVNWGINTDNSYIATRTSDSSGNLTFVHTRSVQDTGFVTMHGAGDSTWSLKDSEQSSFQSSGSSHANIADLSFSKPMGKLNMILDLNRTAGYGPIESATSLTQGSILSNAISLRSSFDAGKGFSVGMNSSLSQNDIGGQSTPGEDFSLNASYRTKNNRLNVVTAYDSSNSGQLATLGSFLNGTSAGYNGNGFSGGYSGASPYSNGFNAGGTNLHRLSNVITYNANQRLNLSANLALTNQSGTDSSNSSAVGLGLSGVYDLHNNQSISLSLDQNNVAFPSSGSYSNSTAIALNLIGSPKGPWNYSVGLSALLSQGGTFAQSSLQWQLHCRNRVHRNQALIFDLSTGNVFQYQPQSTLNFALGYEYQLFKNVALIGRYHIQNVINLDPTITTGAYAARGLDFELDFNFGY